ncbi:MAG: hypothetical protein HGGPFJEG_02912 [Ignavibacteria bacterium]|nr:hypothetical protein [Ignavibacteria bacterium]
MKKLFSLSVIALLFAMNLNSFAQNVNVNPVPATYPTLQAAFAAINGGAHGAGAITVTIVGSTVEPGTATLLGGVFATCIIIPQGPQTVSGNFNASVIDLNGADNVLIDGINTGGHSLTVINPNAGTSANGIQCSNGATNNRIMNLTCVGLGAIGATNGGRGVNIGQSIVGSGGNNDNIIENVTTNGFRRGIQNFGTAGVYINERTTVRGCTIKNFTSLGIFIGSEVSDNTVEMNQVLHDAAVPNDPGGSRAINIQGCGTNIVRRNWIHDLTGTVAGGFIGIITIPVTFTAPIITPVTSIELSNNMVALNSCISTATYVYGIYPTSNANTTNYSCGVYYNSIRIAGSSGTTDADVECLPIGIDGVAGPSTVKVYNNISKNDRTDGGVNSLFVGQFLYYPTPGVTVEADHNISFTTDTTSRGWDAGYNTTVYRGFGGQESYKDTLCDADQEQNTAFIPVEFVSLSLLSLTSNVGANMDAKEIPGISVDFNGDSRAITSTNLFTYRGCDEFYGGKKCYQIYFKLEEIVCYSYRVCIWLRYTIPPYEIWDCSWYRVREWIISTSVACVKIYFGPGIGSGSYYLEVLTKHSIRTQSANPISFAAPTGTYDFTTSPSQAYGGNLAGTAAPYEIFNGDVNQDDIVDGGDGAPVDNDASNFALGCHLSTDVNDDGIVDGGDAAIVDNNASNFVSAILLPGTEPAPTDANFVKSSVKNLSDRRVIHQIPNVFGE